MNESEPLDEVSKIRNLWHQNRGDGRLTGMSTEGTYLPVYSLCGVRHIGDTTFIWAVMRNTGSWVTICLCVYARRQVLRERDKMRSIEADSTEALSSGGLGRNSDEASVMEVERRTGVICLRMMNNHVLWED